MLLEENVNEVRESVTTNAPNGQVSAPLPVDAAEPELDSISSRALPAPLDAATHATPFVFTKNVKLEDLFVTQRWHRPYAEALLAKNPADLPSLITVAERSILDRYLELHLAPVDTDELVDLGHAVEALAQLKKIHPNV